MTHENNLTDVVVVQELAGYTGGDASFLKEDFEIQLNKTLFWDSVSFYNLHFCKLSHRKTLNTIWLRPSTSID